MTSTWPSLRRSPIDVSPPAPLVAELSETGAACNAVPASLDRWVMVSTKAIEQLFRRTRADERTSGEGVVRARVREILLSEHDLFEGIEQSRMRRIAERLPMQRCHRGLSIYEPGDTAERLYILKEGRARLFRLSSDGRKLALAVVGPGTAFGEMSLLGQTMDGTFADAIDECVVCIMTREDLEHAIDENPKLAMRVIALLARRLQQAEAKVEEVAFAPISARVARALLDLANEHDDVDGFSQQELAEYIGASRESVTRTLVEFKTARLLNIGRRCVRLIDRYGLEARARERPHHDRR